MPMIWWRCVAPVGVPSTRWRRFGDKQGDPHQRMGPNLVEREGRVAVAVVPGPAAEKAIHVLHDAFDIDSQPRSGGEFPDPIASSLQGLA